MREGQPRENPSEETGVEKESDELTIRNEEQIVKGNETVKSGEHLIVDQAVKSIFVVEDGAKLTIDQGVKCKVTKHGSAQVEIKTGVKNEVVDA